MLHIILMILKVIGWILLIAVALLILSVLCILFVPLRYRLKAEYYDSADADVHVYWLLHLISVRVHADKQADKELNLHIVLRVLGIRLYDNLRPKKKKKLRQKKSRKTALPKKEISTRTPDEVKIENEKSINVNNIDDTIKKPSGKPLPEAEAAADDGPCKAETEETKQPDGFTVLRRIIDKLKQIFGKIKQSVLQIADKFNNIKDKASAINEKKNKVLDILYSPDNKPAFTKAKKTAFAVVRHMKPAKIRGTIYLGFEDPSTTGYVLGAASLAYPAIGEQLTIYPDFENSVLKGDIYVKGRLRCIVFLWHTLRILFDKDIRRIIKSFQSI